MVQITVSHAGGPEGFARLARALDDLHGAGAADTAVSLRVHGWPLSTVDDVVHGAGFEIVRIAVAPGPGPAAVDVTARRVLSLADTVDVGMTLLVCGLNPSEHAARAGVGFAGPGNRFWSAALAAGLVSRDRDPRHALVEHGVGMTDLVKRATRRADGIAPVEYRTGAARVERLARRLTPAAICFVGLAGWRAAVDRHARAGWQRDGFGGRPAYVMPSTSGLNTHATLDDLVGHLLAAARPQ